MLPARHRMRRSSDFTLAVRRGARGTSSRVVVHLCPAGAGDGDEPAHTLVGFVVARSVGNAVTRNTVKRRLRHLTAARLEAAPPRSRLVVRALPAAAGATSSELAASLDDAMARAVRRLARTSGRP